MKSRQQLRRYESLTKLRQRQEDMKAQVYATAERNVKTAKQECENLERQQQSLLQESTVSEEGQIDIERKRALIQFERYTAQRIVEQYAVIQERTVIAEGKRTELNSAMILRKMMETLSKHSREAIVNEWNRQERYDLDEIATQRAGQQKRKQ